MAASACFLRSCNFVAVPPSTFHECFTPFDREAVDSIHLLSCADEAENLAVERHLSMHNILCRNLTLLCSTVGCGGRSRKRGRSGGA